MGNALSTTPLKSKQNVQLVFRNVNTNKINLCKQKKLIEYVEKYANLYYHDKNWKPDDILRYSKFKVKNVIVVKQEHSMIFEGVLHVDKCCVGKAHFTQEEYKDLIGNGSNGVFESSWDDRPCEDVHLEMPGVRFVE